MDNTQSRHWLGYVLYADGIISILFGLASLLAPSATYGSIIDLAQQGNPLTLSALSSLSIFYCLLGLVCLIAARVPYTHSLALALVMLLRHIWINLEGIANLGSDWIIGNPFHDIIIHSVFIIAYSLAIYVYLRSHHHVKDRL